MKLYLSAALLCLFLFACRKQERTFCESDNYLKNVKESLREKIPNSDFNQLDFAKTIRSKIDSVGIYFLRIPIKDKALRNDFVIVKTNKSGEVADGRIIHIEGTETEYGEGKFRKKKFDGNIVISSLDRVRQINSTIVNGYITAFHSNPASREQLKEGNVMPEVIVVAYVHYDSGIEFSTWLWLNSLFYYSDTGGGGGNYYGSIDGGGYYSGGGGGSYSGTGDSYGVTDETPIQVDVDTYADKSGIDVEQYLKCFDNIPDAGAQCEITIYADIPVDSDPNIIFDFSSGSPGHSFIGIKKLNAAGDQGVQQFIGFYPSTGWKNIITNAPMASKLVDDGQHEFDASFSKSLTPEEFRSVLTEIRYLKNNQYDIDNYNCTDWALNVFNWMGGYGLDIPLYDIPGNYPSTGTQMPQGIYKKLREMKANGAPNADKIQIGFLKGWVSSSDGPCN